MAEERRLLLRGYLAALGGLLVLQVAQLLTGALLARVFPDAALYGRVNLVQQVAGMAALLLGLGIDAALIYDISRGKNAHASFGTAFRSSAWYAAALTGTLVLLAPHIAYMYGAPAMVPELRAGALGLFPAAIINTAQACWIGWGRFGSQAAATVVTQVAGALGLAGGAVLYTSDPAVGAFLVSAGASVLVAGFIVRIIAREGDFRIRLIGPMSEWPRMARYGLPVWFGNFFKAYQGPLIIMLTGAASLAEVGYLSNAFRLSGFAGIITWAFMIVTLPFISGAPSDVQADRANLCMRYNLYLLLPATALLCLYPTELNVWLFGPQFAPAARYLPLIAGGTLLSGFARLTAQCLAGMGKTRVTALLLFLPGATVGVLAPLLVPRQPVLGAWIFLGGWAVSALSALILLPRNGLVIDYRATLGRPLAAVAPLVGAVLLGQWVGGAWHAVLAGAGAISLAALVWRQESAV